MFSGGTGREHDMEWVKINLLITNFIASIFGDNPFVLPVPKHSNSSAPIPIHIISKLPIKW